MGWDDSPDGTMKAMERVGAASRPIQESLRPKIERIPLGRSLLLRYTCMQQEVSHASHCIAQVRNKGLARPSYTYISEHRCACLSLAEALRLGGAIRRVCDVSRNSGETRPCGQGEQNRVIHFTPWLAVPRFPASTKKDNAYHDTTTRVSSIYRQPPTEEIRSGLVGQTASVRVIWRQAHSNKTVFNPTRSGLVG